MNGNGEHHMGMVLPRSCTLPTTVSHSAYTMYHYRVIPGLLTSLGEVSHLVYPAGDGGAVK